MDKKSDVLIIGGGIVGSSCAYELSKRGVKVTLIDKGDVGHGCSYGNAGWVTPCFAMPLPMPGMLLKSIGWLMDPDSPLYIKPRFSPSLFSWLLRFLRSMNHDLMMQSIHALVDISKYSLESYRELDNEFPGRFGFTQKGLLMVSQTESGLAAAEEEKNLVAPLGVPGQSLTAAEVRKLEPALIHDLKGGVFFPTEAHLEPLAVVQTLIQAAQAKGAEVVPRTEVYDFVIQRGKIQEVHTTRGVFKADQVMLATGTWSPLVVNKLNLNVPILGGKGYALIVKPLQPQPQIPLMLIERKIAVTPRAQSLRLAGTLELVGPNDDSITARRVQAIIKGSQKFLNVPADPEIIELWRGLRPCTPDGVPVIGYSEKITNLLISAGHQMLGLQSGPGSARLAADLLTQQTPKFNPHPFRASRF